MEAYSKVLAEFDKSLLAERVSKDLIQHTPTFSIYTSQRDTQVKKISSGPNKGKAGPFISQITTVRTFM